jgi:5-methylcytosine-specific restriction endonuclease McrBC regulatory subunit McrC
VALGEVSVAPVDDADFALSATEPRASHYEPLLRVCRLLRDGFLAARLPEAGNGGFLIDLSRAFERYLATGLSLALARHSAWAVETHPAFAVGPTELQPDLLVRHRGAARCVLDAKWKAPGPAPDATDLHQVIAYACVTGANHVGLVYPGRRFAYRTIGIPGSDVTVSLFRVCVVGTGDECSCSFTRLSRKMRMSNSGRDNTSPPG